MNRQQRIETAAQTLEIIKQGYYINTNKQTIHIADDVKRAVEGSKHYTPLELDTLITTLPVADYATTFEVHNETTLAATARLASSNEKVLCLNFASAKNPGGGFLNGSQAQEESLARSSAMYPAIEQMQDMYQTNRKTGSCLYTDHMIYSPAVPMFRNDEGRLLDSYYKCSVITSPAVNAGVVIQQEPDNVGRIKEVMLSRTEKVLALAAYYGHHTLVLGAWGCGVFRNDPSMVAECFKHYLVEDVRFNRLFKHITFAALDNTTDKKIFNAFKEAFNHETITL